MPIESDPLTGRVADFVPLTPKDADEIRQEIAEGAAEAEPVVEEASVHILGNLALPPLPMREPEDS